MKPAAELQRLPRNHRVNDNDLDDLKLFVAALTGP
jgi:hypothetical protein